MSLPVFPIFALQVDSPYVIAAGGGGNIKYGKRNGIVVYDLTTNIGITFYETTDVVDFLVTWRRIGKEDEIVIVACCQDSMHILELKRQKIKLIYKFPYRCTFAYFNKVIYAICKENIVMGAYKYFPKKLPELSKPFNEDYVYEVEHKGNNCGLAHAKNIPPSWHSLFFVNNKVHKVVISKGRYSFVFNDKRYVFDEEVSRITYIPQNETLVFFIRDESTIYTIHKLNVKKTFVHKLTCINIDHDGIVIGTGDGKIYLLDNRLKLLAKYRLPITAVSKKDKYVYFTSFDGCIDRRPIRDRRWIAVIIFILIILVICGKIFMLK